MIVAALAVLLVVGLLAAGALEFSLRSLNTSSADRSRAVALAAADEGADLAGWRMNHLLLTAPASLLGITPSLGCIVVGTGGQLSVATATLSTSGGLSLGVCSNTSWEDAGNNAWFMYSTQTDVNLNNQVGLGSGIVERRIQVVGCAPADSAGACASGGNGIQYRRLLVTHRLNTTSSGGVFARYRYVECTPASSATWSPSGAATGCSDPGY